MQISEIYHFIIGALHFFVRTTIYRMHECGMYTESHPPHKFSWQFDLVDRLSLRAKPKCQKITTFLHIMLIRGRKKKPNKTPLFYRYFYSSCITYVSVLTATHIIEMALAKIVYLNLL